MATMRGGGALGWLALILVAFATAGVLLCLLAGAWVAFTG